MAEMTHAEKIQRHFDIIGKPNPFKAIHAAQARAGERKGGLGSNKGADSIMKVHLRKIVQRLILTVSLVILMR